MQTVMISGCSGFLGYHILKEFMDLHYRVIGVDKRPVPGNHPLPHKFIQTDIHDLNVRDLMGVDIVIHLAWRTNIPDCKRHPERSTKDNINMSVHLIEVCKEAGVKQFLFPSTASLYGNNSLPWTEDLKPEPIEPYSWQKYAVEEYLKMSGLDWYITRFFQIFGEYQREDTALAAFLRMKKAGEPVTLTETMAQSKFKSGQRDFLYAGDLAKALKVILQTGKCDTYNIASGVVNTMEEVAAAMKTSVKWIPRREYEVERHEADVTKIKSLSWQPEVEVISWLKSQYGV